MQYFEKISLYYKGGLFMKHIISALMENRPGVLRRLSGLFGRRGYNIESIVASATENPDVTRMTIVVDGDEYIIDQVIKQLVKLQEIIEVENCLLYTSPSPRDA